MRTKTDWRTLTVLLLALLVGYWRAGSNVVGEWIRVHFGKLYQVYSVTTQRRYGYLQYLSSYYLVYEDLSYVSDASGTMLFTGNANDDNHKENVLPSGVIGVSLAIEVVNYIWSVATRLEMLGYAVSGKHSFLSSTITVHNRLFMSKY